MNFSNRANLPSKTKFNQLLIFNYHKMQNMLRRSFVKSTMAASALNLLSFDVNSLIHYLSLEKMKTRVIPSTNEALPIIGLGTWIQFDVASQSPEVETLKLVLIAMHEKGGTLIDSSPMYGQSEKVVGDLTHAVQLDKEFFYATKVWTNGEKKGIAKMVSSMEKMRRTQMDLMQIHNLMDWKTHLKTLKQWKETGKIRYIGITHYQDSSHLELERIITQEKSIDFVQFNYSIAERNAEKRLLPAAKDNGVAVIINRPYLGGELFRKSSRMTLPAWSEEYGITSWGQFFLKYIVSHPSVNCVIPGTSKVKHLVDNMGAGYGRLPDEKVRSTMRKLFS
jgi:diketogulonate reductase-like aldo/keto reductase